MNKNIFIAVADNLSKTKAYEYAEDYGFTVVGESAYINDASECICKENVDLVICSHKLIDGNAKDLYNNLPQHIKDSCKTSVITPLENGSYTLKQIPHSVLYHKYSVVESVLEYVSLSSHNKGYPLIKAALEIILSTPDALFEITRKIIVPIANAYDTSTNNVEFDMRFAKDQSLINCSADVMEAVFGQFCDSKSISLGVYLSKLYEYILKTR